MGLRMLEIAERLDQRAEAIMSLGERLDQRAEAIMALGERLDGRAVELIELGDRMSDLGGRIDVRGAEIADRAGQVVETGSDLIAVMPTFERALEMATPLEGAIDRFGRLVDRLPGGARRPRPGSPQAEPAGTEAALPEASTRMPSEPSDDHGPGSDASGEVRPLPDRSI